MFEFSTRKHTSHQRQPWETWWELLHILSSADVVLLTTKCPLKVNHIKRMDANHHSNFQRDIGNSSLLKKHKYPFKCLSAVSQNLLKIKILFGSFWSHYYLLCFFPPKTSKHLDKMKKKYQVFEYFFYVILNILIF